MFGPSLWRVRRMTEAMPNILDLQREMNRLFSSVGQKSTQEYPAVNIWDSDAAAVVSTELPGMDPEKISVTVTGDILTIKGGPMADANAEKESYLRRERLRNDFQRSVQLPFHVEPKEVDARYEKGILTVTLPRLKEDAPRRIKINS